MPESLQHFIDTQKSIIADLRVQLQQVETQRGAAQMERDALAAEIEEHRQHALDKALEEK